MAAQPSAGGNLALGLGALGGGLAFSNQANKIPREVVLASTMVIPSSGGMNFSPVFCASPNPSLVAHVASTSTSRRTISTFFSTVGLGYAGFFLSGGGFFLGGAGFFLAGVFAAGFLDLRTTLLV